MSSGAVARRSSQTVTHESSAFVWGSTAVLWVLSGAGASYQQLVFRTLRWGVSIVCWDARLGDEWVSVQSSALAVIRVSAVGGLLRESCRVRGGELDGVGCMRVQQRQAHSHLCTSKR